MAIGERENAYKSKQSGSGGIPDEQYSRVYDALNRSSAGSEELNLKTKVDNWWTGSKEEFRHRQATYSPLDWAAVFLPCLSWLRTYKRSFIYSDILAGLSVGFMVIPQGMSYAVLAGLPPVYGLYGAFVPVIIYAAFGSSPQLAVGPVAVTSLLLSDGLRDIFPESKAISDPAKPKGAALIAVQEEYNIAATHVALLVAILYTAVGVFRLGFLARFLSHSVISGFTSGAALVIASSQLKYFFGVKTPNTSTVIEAFQELSKVWDDTQWREALMFSAFLFALLSIKHLSKRFQKLRWMRPLGPISVVLFAIIITKIFNLYDGRIKIVKTIPSGLPGSTVHHFDSLFHGGSHFGKKIKLAIIIMLVDFMESISIAKALARKGKYHIRITQEIIGLGIANFFGAFFHSYTTTGSFSRSAVSADVGSKTQMFAWVQAIVVGCVLLFLTPVFRYTPYAAIGAVIVSGVFGLVDFPNAIFLWKANKLDFIVWFAAFVGTVLAGVEIGLAIAIGLALLFVIHQTAFPHTANLGRLPGTEVYRSVKQYPAATESRGIVVVRIDAPVYFANVQTVRSRIDKYLARAKANLDIAPVEFLVIDLSPVTFVDATGMHTFTELVEDLQEQKIQLVLANPGATVKRQLEKVKLLETIGREWVFVRTADAVSACTKYQVNAKVGEKDSDGHDGLTNRLPGGLVEDAPKGV